jgi:hypothetical protein
MLSPGKQWDGEQALTEGARPAALIAEKSLNYWRTLPY